MADDKQEHINWFPHILVIGSIAVIAIIILSLSGYSHRPQKNAVWADKSPPTIFTRIHKKGHKPEKVKLPHRAFLDAKEHYTYNVTWTLKKNGATMFKIIPDDCVEKLVINGTELKLREMKEVNQDRLCSWSSGFVIELKKYLKVGKNTIDLTISNTAGPGGLRIQTR